MCPITYQVILFGNLQEQSFVPFVDGEDHVHLLLVFQTDAAEHGSPAVQHFDNLVWMKLKVDEIAVCLGTLPLQGWRKRMQEVGSDWLYVSINKHLSSLGEWPTNISTPVWGG